MTERASVCPELVSNQRPSACRADALPLSYRGGSGGGIRTRDVRLMRPARTTELLYPASAAEGNRTPAVRIRSPEPGHQAPAASCCALLWTGTSDTLLQESGALSR